MKVALARGAGKKAHISKPKTWIPLEMAVANGAYRDVLSACGLDPKASGHGRFRRMALHELRSRLRDYAASLEDESK